MNHSDNVKSVNLEKIAVQDSDRWPSADSYITRSHWRLVIVIALCVFFGEAFVMVAIHPLFHFSTTRLVALLDAFFLIILISPALYFFVFRPMVLNINERKRTEQALRESELRFRTVFQTSPDAVTLSRLDDGMMIDVNEGFTRLSKYSKQEIKGRTSLDINIWHDPKDREKMVDRLQEDGQLENFEAEFKRKDDQVITGLLSTKVIMLNAEPHILAVTRDITNWKTAQKKLQASHQFLQIANRYNEMRPMLNEFINEIKKLIKCSAVGMRILDENGNIPYQAFEGFSQKFYKSENPHTIDTVNCMCANVVLHKTDLHHPYFTEAGSFCIDSTSRFLTTLSEEEKAQTCDVCNRFGYESVALVPIRLGDKILGLIHVADPRHQFFTSEAIELLEGAAMQLGTAIERVRAEEALQESHRELEKRVADRTAELVSAIELLNIEIEERKYNEKKLLEQQEKLRSLSSDLVLTEERERRHIATELHDRIGQTLAVTKIKLAELREASASNETAAKALDNIRQYIEQTIQDTRSLTFELSPPVLYELGLEAALAWLINQTREKHGLRIELKDDGRSKQLDNGCRVIVFQAVRELLFNIVKHARAHSATVTVRKDDDDIRIDIEDDGSGFDSSELEASGTGSRGFGIFSIRERLSPLGGHLEIKTEPGCGTHVTLVVPLSCGIENTGEHRVT
jgi:PAS domain S-box-containing protein